MCSILVLGPLMSSCLSHLLFHLQGSQECLKIWLNFISVILPFNALPLQEMSFLQLNVMTGSEHNGRWLQMLHQWTPTMGETLLLGL
jgi:hypothetical protein